MTNAEFIIDGYEKYQKKMEFTPDTVKDNYFDGNDFGINYSIER